MLVSQRGHNATIMWSVVLLGSSVAKALSASVKGSHLGCGPASFLDKPNQVWSLHLVQMCFADCGQAVQHCGA